MRNKSMTLALSGLVAGLCLSAGELSAWQRSAMDDCKKEMEGCNKSHDKCKKDMEHCKKHVDKHDASSFERQLNSHNQNRFVQFSQEQKNKAMDMADKNKMDPNKAVDKVAAKK